MALTLSLLLTTLLCLAFAATRVFGIVGMFLLLNLYPVSTLAVLTVVGIAAYYYHHF